MTEKNKEATTPTMQTVEEFEKSKHIRLSIVEGTMALKNWTRNKLVTEKEFDKAINDFINIPII